MACRFLVFCFIYFQVVNSQYYPVPPPNYPAYSYSYYSPAIPPSPTFSPPIASNTAKQPLKTPKRSVVSPSCPKCSPSTASAYYLSTPSENIKATVMTNEKQTEKTIPPPKYNCPLCNGFADVPPNPKISPPPPIGSPVLPGIIDEIPTIVIPKNLTINDPGLLKKEPFLGDTYEKRKLLKNMRFDQDLLEGFLAGLGMASSR